MPDYEKEHRKLWNWLADHPKASKSDYFKSWKAGDRPKTDCFACEVARQKAKQAGTIAACSFCPLGGVSILGCLRGLYYDWATTVSPERRRELALKIANLPWKEDDDA